MNALVAAAAIALSAAVAAHTVPFFPAASDGFRQGFVRIINHSPVAGEVRIDAIDDRGRAADRVTLTIEAGATVHFNSTDLERGNPAKGLSGGAGAGSGDWRLAMDSDLDLEVLGYVRTTDGFVTAMHDVVASADGVHRVPIFNPASNYNQVSRLRIVNPGSRAAQVTIRGTDDLGRSSDPGVELSIPPGAARTLDAQQLESGGDHGPGLGDGEGKWRLAVESAQPIAVMSLLESPTGHLSNLSTAPVHVQDGVHTVPFLPAAGGERQGFLRVTNRSGSAGAVRIRAFDDSDWDHDPITLSLDANATVHFNTADLESGNSEKGLSGGVGTGQGHWRLELSSDLDIDVLAYVRTAQGFLAAMHDVAPSIGARHRVAFFNPGSNDRQVSQLRIVNPGGQPAAVVVAGIDGQGAGSAGDVRLTVPAGQARTLTAQELEAGGNGLEGSLGDGAGKWQFNVRSERPIWVLSLLASPTGHLTNLSTAPGRGAGGTAAEVFDALVAGPVVESKCLNCHVQGGEAGDTRLLFVPATEADHRAANLEALRDFVAAVDEGAALILDKIQGIGHGGGEQVRAGSPDFENVARLLDRLEREAAPPAPPPQLAACADAACDREVLVAVHKATGGGNWHNQTNWGSAQALGDWYGVETNADGRVIKLNLNHNGLTGPFPEDLTRLTELELLDLTANNFTGGLPRSIGNLRALKAFRCSLCRLPGRIPAGLGNLHQLDTLALNSNRLYGEIPPDLGRLAKLRALVLSRNGLSGRIPRELGRMAALESLELSFNNLTGEIPNELSNLRELRNLDLQNNALTGFIPKWHGLPELQWLYLGDNLLLGGVPPELGGLARLKHLVLDDNQLTGELPPELGNLTNLQWLSIEENLLSGEIPAWLAEFTQLTNLSLAHNRLSGPVPTWLSRLPLEYLDLGGNVLTGEIPAELGRIHQLRALALDGNGLTGKLPQSLSGLDLERLNLGGNDLCVDFDDAVMKRWLWGIDRLLSRIANCPNPHPVYLVQSAQSFESPVTLVAGKPALLRVFLSADEAAGEPLPAVKANFHGADGELVFAAEIPADGRIRRQVSEGSLDASANAEIPGHVIRPGVELAVEVGGSSLALPSRIPAEGRIPLDVQELPPFELTLVPFLEDGSPDHTVLEVVDAMVEQGLDHPLLHDTADLLPLRRIRLTKHEPVMTHTISGTAILAMVAAMRAAEGGTGYWLGMLGYSDGWRQGAGHAFLGGWAAYSPPDAETIAHELGHTMDLSHAPCGGADGADPWFPDPNARIGSWGWEPRYGVLVSPRTYDIMSYCGPVWTSEYGFSRALAFRMREGSAGLARAREPALLLWGGVDESGAPYLRPSFLIDAVAQAPLPGGDYRISGRTADGPAFSLSFDMPPLPDAPGQRAFVITLPVTWSGALQSIRLASPDRSATLDHRTDAPMTILRDPSNGQVRAFLDRPAIEAAGRVPGALVLEAFETRGIATP